MSRWPFVLAAVIGLAAAAIYGAFRQDLNAAHARLVGRSALADTTFGALEYASAGAGEPVLTIHGAAGGFDQGLDMTGALAAQGYRVIAPSRFGYLRSARPAALTTAMQADAYVQLLDQQGIEKVAVVGISAGAWSALQFAVRHPDRCRALILLVPADYLPPGVSIQGGAVTRAIFNSDFVAWSVVKAMPVLPNSMTRMILGTDGRIVRKASPSEQTRVRRILEHLAPVGPRAKGMEFDIATAAGRETYPLKAVRCPVLAISAEDDPFGTAKRARQIAAAAPDGRAIVFPSGGHDLVGHFSDALGATSAFLKETGDPAAL